MVRKILHGFLFGLGFSAAIAVVAWVVATMKISSLEQSGETATSGAGRTPSYQEQARWRDLSTAQKTTEISAVVLLRFEEEAEGLMAARVARIEKRDEAIELPYSVGDRVQAADYYARKPPSSNRDGVLFLFSGDPPKQMQGTYLYDNRLAAEGDMPLEIFFSKLEDAWNN